MFAAAVPAGGGAFHLVLVFVLALLLFFLCQGQLLTRNGLSKY